MRIIIYGANELGSLFASELFEDHDITIIDCDSSKLESFSKLDLNTIVGNAANILTLKKANIKNTDFFIACTMSDEANIVACLTVKQIAHAKVICFISTEEYVASLTYVKDNAYRHSLLYMDHVVWPEELLTQEIFEIATVPEAVDVEYFADDKARLLEYKLKDDSPFLNKKIKDIQFEPDVLIVGIVTDDKLAIPSGDTLLSSGDRIILMGTNHSLNITVGKLFAEKNKIKNITIVGGGNVGFMLAKRFEHLGIRLKIIETNKERCEFLAENLNSVLVINADGTNLEILQEENIKNSDVFISVTNNDEKNLLCSLLAKQLGVSRVITRASKASTASLFTKVGVDIAVSSNEYAINTVKNHLIESNVGILTTVVRGQGTVLEVVLSSDFKAVELKNIKFPTNAIVAIIERENRIIIPKGQTMINPADKLIIFTMAEDEKAIREFFKS